MSHVVGGKNMCVNDHQKERVWASCPYLSHTVSWALFLGYVFSTLATLFPNCMTLHMRRLFPSLRIAFSALLHCLAKVLLSLKISLNTGVAWCPTPRLGGLLHWLPQCCLHIHLLTNHTTITYTSVSSKKQRPIRAILFILYLQWSVVSDIWGMK